MWLIPHICLSTGEGSAGRKKKKGPQWQDEILWTKLGDINLQIEIANIDANEFIPIW